MEYKYYLLGYEFGKRADVFYVKFPTLECKKAFCEGFTDGWSNWPAKSEEKVIGV